MTDLLLVVVLSLAALVAARVLLRKAVVPEGYAGLLYSQGRYTRTLGAGPHWLWRLRSRVELVDLQMTRIDFPPAVADSVYKRMIAARQQAAADERAKGTAEADKIKADADRQQEAILAEAYSQAQTIKGEGDGKAASIAADAYGRDPQFYQFYQSLEAYKKTFKPGDVMVVDPGSEFFRFMRGPNGGADAAPALKR